MKKTIIILLFNFCWVCGYSAGDSIPELNKRVLRVCDSLLGKKVGNGDCNEFVLEVLNRLNVNKIKKIVEIKKRFRKFIKEPENYHVKAGDIIYIKGSCRFIDTLTWEVISWKSPHVAIIHHKIDSYTAAIIHQFKGQNVYIVNLPIGGMYRGKIRIDRAIY